MFDVQVCMVSTQAAPNLLPLLDDELKPKEVILLVTEAMKEKANQLQATIRPTGIKVQTGRSTANQPYNGVCGHHVESLSTICQ